MRKTAAWVLVLVALVACQPPVEDPTTIDQAWQDERAIIARVNGVAVADIEVYEYGSCTMCSPPYSYRKWRCPGSPDYTTRFYKDSAGNWYVANPYCSTC